MLKFESFMFAYQITEFVNSNNISKSDIVQITSAVDEERMYYTIFYFE